MIMGERYPLSCFVFVVVLIVLVHPELCKTVTIITTITSNHLRCDARRGSKRRFVAPVDLFQFASGGKLLFTMVVDISPGNWKI